MTINAPAALLLLLYQLVGEEQGVDPAKLTGTIQNDVLKEYIARGTYIFPPKPSLRLVTDLFRYCRAEIPRWNTISISGYHMAEAGATPVQEIAFTLADGIEYVRAAVASGQDVDDFAPRLAFFFVARTTLLEEIAKFRRRDGSGQMMRDEFGASVQVAMRASTSDRRRALPRSNPVNLVGSRCRDWAPSSAARSRCTRMRTTRRSHCRRRRPRVSPYAPSRSWRTRPT